MTASPSPESPSLPPPPASAWKVWPWRILRVVLALLPVWWLSSKVAWHEVWESAQRVGLVAMAGSVVAALGSFVFGCFRWRVMMRAYGGTNLPSIPTLLRHNLIGGYFNVLPSGVAGDAVRGLRVRKYLPSLTTSYTVLFVERITGLLGLCIIAAAAILASHELRDNVVNTVLEYGVAGALGLSLVVLVLPFVLQRRPDLRAKLERIPVAGTILAKIPPAQSLRGPLVAVFLSVFTQASVVLSVALILRPLAPTVTLTTCARIVPAVILFTYIPLTPGGLGQREAAFVYLFGLAGVGAAVATATSLLFFGVSMLLAASGGALLLAERVFSWEASLEKGP